MNKKSKRPNKDRKAADAPLELTVQYATRRPWVPARNMIALWAYAALGPRFAPSELSVRVVGPAEGRRLNKQYRGKDKPTNVLSFPAADAASVDERKVLGDLVICADVVAREAREQGKARAAHWAHLVIHGTLHLLGYDHERPADARRMERREIGILKSLGYPNPYVVD